MGTDVCPECGREYIRKQRVDARDNGGKLFDDYVHEVEDRPLFNEVVDNCYHTIEEE